MRKWLMLAVALIAALSQAGVLPPVLAPIVEAVAPEIVAVLPAEDVREEQIRFVSSSNLCPPAQ